MVTTEPVYGIAVKEMMYEITSDLGKEETPYQAKYNMNSPVQQHINHPFRKLFYT
jgi:hypothetical protein